jgi:S-adenosylmethionine hydrolase
MRRIGEGMPMVRQVITLTTDYGYAGHFVGAMKGVILKIAPEAHIVDITHDVPPFDVLEAALTIAGTAPFYPAGTIHVVVVDPGVGTARRPILVEAGGQFFIAPDNGVLTLVSERTAAAKVWHITAEQYFLVPLSKTFHGRDIFAPVAAWLAKNGRPADFGREVTDYARLQLPKPKRNDGVITGSILRQDHFGNLMTSVKPEDVREIMDGNSPFRIRIHEHEVRRIVETFAEGRKDEVVVLVGSSGYLEIVVNGGSAAEMLDAGPKVEVAIEMEGK